MNIPFPDLTPVIPELIVIGVATLLLMVELVAVNKRPLGYIGIATAAVAAYFVPISQGVTFNGMFISDMYAVPFKFIFLISLVLTILISLRYLDREHADFGEYYSLLLFSTAGMMLMASARDLIMVFLGLELMSLCLYILAGIKRHDHLSSEAAMKYFLLGGFATAIMLYGISFVYGITGTTDLYAVMDYLQQHPASPALLMAIAFIIAALAFKIAAVPFHMWAPDVYEGSPTSITAFMSTGPKAAAFTVFGRVFLTAFMPAASFWTDALIVIAVVTMIGGNLLALNQVNIKRMLAFSSIAHAGYLLLAVIAGTGEAVNAMALYLLTYTFMNIGAFGVVIYLEKGELITDYNGLSKTHPVIAAIMLVFMFSLAGIPPTGGFTAKFSLFMAAIHAGYHWLVVLAVLMSAVSAYYYLRIVMNMYMKPSVGIPATAPNLGLAAALILSVMMIFVIGIAPSAIIP